MSQASPRVCPTCQTPVEPGQRFCFNCGATLSGAPSPTTGPSAPAPMGYAPTVASSGMQPPLVPPTPSYPSPTIAASAPPPTGYAPTVASSGMQPPIPSQPTPAQFAQYPYSQYPGAQYTTPGGTPPPPYSSPDPYTAPPAFGYAPPANNKTSLWVYIAIGAAVLLLLCGGSSYFLLKAVGGNSGKSSILGGSNFASSQSLSNLSIIYASDQISFTSIQQADKFSDDTFTSFNEHPNFVRLSFKEQQTSTNSSYFSYDESFRLVLPDHTVVAAQNAQNTTGPQQQEVRTNWVDFPTSAKVDLSNLTLRLGGQDEAQMDVPLKNGADLSKYQPKVTNPNTPFTYAQLNWTLENVTESLYFAGQQAKTGQVYITVKLRADNHSNYRVWLFGSFVHLKANGNNLSPTLDSYTNAFDDMEPGTTNHEGIQTFLTQPSPDGKYTLDFLPDKNGDWPEQTVDFQIS